MVIPPPNTCFMMSLVPPDHLNVFISLYYKYTILLDILSTFHRKCQNIDCALFIKVDTILNIRNEDGILQAWIPLWLNG